MKNSALFFVISLLFTINSYAQTASATWALTADTVAVVIGNIIASAQVLSDTMSVKDYSGGDAAGPAERIWRTNLNWPKETAQNNARYVQYSVSPTSGNSFTIQSITLNIGCYGTVGHFFANIYYSTDSTFATLTKLNSYTLALPDIRYVALAALSYTSDTIITSGQTFYLRIYPWCDGSPTASKYLCLANVLISGVISDTIDRRISVSPSVLPSFGPVVGGNVSTSQSYTVSGENLRDNINITAPIAFQVSVDGSTFGDSVRLTQSGGIVPPTTLYARFAPSSTNGSLGGNITHASGGAISKTVSISGAAVAAEPTVSSVITFGSAGGDSMVVNFAGGDGNNRILVACPNIAVSWMPTDGSDVSGVSSHFFTAIDQGNGNKVVYDGTGSSVIVTGVKSMTTYYFAVYEYNVGTNNSQNYLTTSPGTGSQTTPVISLTLDISSASLSFGNVTINAISSEQTYTLSGSNLIPASGSITIAAPSGYQISMKSDVEFTASIILSYGNGGLALTTIYVRFLPTAVQSYNGNITNDGGGATTYVAVSGRGVDTIVGGDYFVATWGSDTSSGIFDQPFATINKAISVANAGDTIYVRGGRYTDTTIINILKSGTSSNKYYLFAYPGERPILDFSAMSVSSSNNAIKLEANYWYIQGFDIKGAGNYGMYITGSNNIIEFCALYENRSSGLWFYGGASNNQIINCDSYYNYDPPNGTAADGFSAQRLCGTGNYFYGCRSWQNSDDGWDGYGATTTTSTTIENCWTFMSGYLKNGTVWSGDGNGFKMGGNYTQNDLILKRCLTFGNKSKGFDQNHNKGSMTLYNCTGHNNGANNYQIYEALASGETLELANCIEIQDKRSINTFAIQITNSWMPPFDVTQADFVSLDTTGVRGPRKLDGSLPDVTFMHLAAGSDLIDAGTYVELPYNGLAPDLGAFETPPIPTGVEEASAARISGFRLWQNYPNPFNPSTTISFQLSLPSNVSLKVFDILGREITTLVNERKPSGFYNIAWKATGLPSGVYFYRLQAGNYIETKKLILLR